MHKEAVQFSATGQQGFLGCGQLFRYRQFLLMFPSMQFLLSLATRYLNLL
jgi:hypothetical protein